MCHAIFELCKELFFPAALLAVRNRVEAEKRERELIEAAEREGKPTDDIKVRTTLHYFKNILPLILATYRWSLVKSIGCTEIK